jgi:hypothetical protein
MIFIYNYFTIDSAGMATKWEDIFSKMAYVMIGLSISISLIIWMVGAIANISDDVFTACGIEFMHILNANQQIRFSGKVNFDFGQIHVFEHGRIKIN